MQHTNDAYTDIRDYWRDLLRLTLNELITEPNYTPADLARVRRPVLVIQGANDRVNAAGRHAQYLAENIPAAEMWLPAGVNHNVHRERPDEWLSRVLDFYQRRAARPRFVDGDEMVLKVGGDIADDGADLGEGDGEFHRGWIIAEPGADCEKIEHMSYYFRQRPDPAVPCQRGG